MYTGLVRSLAPPGLVTTQSGEAPRLRPFKYEFIEMLRRIGFPMYSGLRHAMLGNHDYHDERNSASASAQLTYGAKVPASRWTMP